MAVQIGVADDEDSNISHDNLVINDAESVTSDVYIGEISDQNVRQKPV